jgi:hypothetical protein
VTPEEFQRRRLTIAAGLRGVLLPLTRLLRPGMPAAEWAAWVAAAYPAVYRARVEHWEIAQAFYREERARATGTAGPVDFPRRYYALAALAAGLDRVRPKPRPVEVEEDEGTSRRRTEIEEILAVAERHAAAGGREAMVDAARHDPDALGYARTTVGLENCAFCLMLVSRGPVYKTQSAALLRDGTSEPYHDRCDCIATPVFNRASWPGRDEYLEMRAAWAEHGGDLTTWRRYIASRKTDEAGERRSA